VESAKRKREMGTGLGELDKRMLGRAQNNRFGKRYRRQGGGVKGKNEMPCCMDKKDHKNAYDAVGRKDS